MWYMTYLTHISFYIKRFLAKVSNTNFIISCWKQIWILTYCLDLVLSNKYIQVNIQCLEQEVFNVKVDVLFIFYNKEIE